MTEAPAEPKRRIRPQIRGCLLRVAIVAAALAAIVVVIGTIFDQGDSADQPVQGIDAGPAGGYPAPSVNYLEQDHVFITRLQDGTFIALYDKSTRQQELKGDCRVRFDETQSIPNLEPLPGLPGAFVEDCNNTLVKWRADGKFAFGNGYGDLDRFATNINKDGRLIIDTSSRTCTRSRGVPGQEPFDIRQCGAPEELP